MNYRYFLAIFTLITVIVIAWILRPTTPIMKIAPGINGSILRWDHAKEKWIWTFARDLVLADPLQDSLPKAREQGGEARESTENCDLTGEGSSMENSRGGQNLLSGGVESGHARTEPACPLTGERGSRPNAGDQLRSGSSAPSARNLSVSFSHSAFSGENRMATNKGMAASAERGTAPKPVKVNEEASVGRSNIGNIKYDANLSVSYGTLVIS